jgi:hypothetical protein
MGREQEPLYRQWTVALGVPSVVFGTGIALMTVQFWFGVVIAYCGAGWFLIDWGLISYGKHPLARVAGAGVPIAMAAAISWIAFRPAPLSIEIYRVDANYEDGSVVAGIKWKSRYSDLRISLSNPSAGQYTNIVMTLRTDQMIAGVGSTNPISQCQSSAEFPGVRIGGATLNFPTKDGIKSIPMFVPESGPVAATQYKITCDRIIAGESLELVVAVQPNIVPGQRWEKTSPAWVSLIVEYDALIRPNRPQQIRKCLSDNCTNIQPVIE